MNRGKSKKSLSTARRGINLIKNEGDANVILSELRNIKYNCYQQKLLHYDTMNTWFLSSSATTPGILTAGQYLQALNSEAFLLIQADGNLVLYSGVPSLVGIALWDSKSVYLPGDFFLAMQSDGNLVIYQGTPVNRGAYVWNSETHGEFGDYFVCLQNDLNVVVYHGSGPGDNRGPVWSSKFGKFLNLWDCEASWNIEGLSVTKVTGRGNTKEEALEQARARCMDSQLIDSNKGFCLNNPASESYRQI